MNPNEHSRKPRVFASMTTFFIVVLIGMGSALYLCTPREGYQEWSGRRAVATGLAGCVAVFVLMALVTLGATLAGLRDAADQRRRNPQGTRITTPEWMGATVALRMALGYVLYAFMGFAMGGGLAAVLGALNA
jgi:hypothetical protein